MNKRNITVGIITMHRVLNFGSVLQTYALQQTVSNLGYSSEIIDYKFPNSEHFMYLEKSDEQAIILPLKSRIIDAIKRRLCASKPSDEDIRRGKFLQFISDHLKISKDSYRNRYQIDKQMPLYDVYLTGSDQVWNPSYIGYDTTFMCGFARNGNPRISFAASMAVAEIPEQFVEYYRTELGKYSSISVREQTTIGLLSKITGKAISLVCDPTMLLTKEQWLKQLNVSDSSKYFIVYVLDYTYNPYPQIFEIIKNCHHRYGGKIIVLNGKIDQYMKKNGANLNSQLDDIVKLDAQAKDQFEQYKADDLKKVEEEIKNVKSATSSDIDRLRDTLTFGNFSEAQVNSLEAMKAELFADESDLNSMRSEEELTKAIETVKLQKKDNEGKKDFLGYLISAVNEYAVKRAEVMLTPLKMDKAAIKLSEVVKGTGEIKDTFKFTYDGKDYRWLSNSERIKAGLEIAMLVKRLTGLTYPTFVDNAESINTNFTRPDGQMIFAFVRRCAITVHEPSPAAVKEAA